MLIEKFAEPLRDLGLTPRNYEAIRVLPLVFVAWADHQLEEVERSCVLEFAHEKLQLNADALRLVEGWLSHPPSATSVQSGLSFLRKAADAPDELDFGTDEVLQLLWEAESLTRQVALLSGTPYDPPIEQQAATLELAETLGVDTGMPWLAMLRELGGSNEIDATLKDSTSNEVAASQPASKQVTASPLASSQVAASRPTSAQGAPDEAVNTLAAERARRWRAALQRREYPADPSPQRG